MTEDPKETSLWSRPGAPGPAPLGSGDGEEGEGLRDSEAGAAAQEN